MPPPEQVPEEPEWRIDAVTAYAASYIFLGRFPRGEEAEWGRGRRPEDDDQGPPVWVEVVVALSVIGTYLICVLPDYLAATAATTTERGATALALLPTCRPLAHGPPMCYDWERPAMAPPPGSGPDDGDWSHDDDDGKASAECSTGLVLRDDADARTTGTALMLLPTCLPFADALPMCYECERPAAMAPPPGSSGGSTGGESNRRKAGHNEDDAMECFYGLVRDATRTCYAEWERRRTMAPPSSSDWSGNNDNDKATMECFYAAVRNADKACLGWSYDGDNTVAARPIRLLGHGNGDPLPTLLEN